MSKSTDVNDLEKVTHRPPLPSQRREPTAELKLTTPPHVSRPNNSTALPFTQSNLPPSVVPQLFEGILFPQLSTQSLHMCFSGILANQMYNNFLGTSGTNGRYGVNYGAYTKDVVSPLGCPGPYTVALSGPKRQLGYMEMSMLREKNKKKKTNSTIADPIGPYSRLLANLPPKMEETLNPVAVGTELKKNEEIRKDPPSPPAEKRETEDEVSAKKRKAIQRVSLSYKNRSQDRRLRRKA